MKKICKISVCLIIFLLFSPLAFASEKIHATASINQNFSLSDMPDNIQFKSEKEIFFNNIIVPENSIITAKTLEAQSERRWHKSGYIILQVLNYETELGNIIDLQKEKIYLIAKKYEKIKGKDAAITGAELAATTAASFVVPGIDIAYYFTKGAIQKKENKNRFKSGVSNAYENSIFWFWLKGKPIELNENEEISLYGIDEEKALKLTRKIEQHKK